MDVSLCCNKAKEGIFNEAFVSKDVIERHACESSNDEELSDV